ncbi:PglD-related sugar-binding protein [Bacillus coreaensis]
MIGNLLIVGAGGHGRVVNETAIAMNSFGKIDFLDDNSDIAIGKCNEYGKFVNNYNYAVIALGKNKIRMKWTEELIKVGFQIPILIEPTSYVSQSASIAAGSIICAKAVVNTNVKIGMGSIISVGALIDNDSYDGEYCHINASAIVKANSKIDRLKKLDAGMIC